MRVATVMPVACDVSLAAFEDAVYQVGAAGCVAEVTLFCPENAWKWAEEICDKHKCKCALLPIELAKPYHWGVRWKGNVVWSAGT